MSIERRTSDRPVTIYGLVDPARGHLMYVGKTVRPIAERIKNHWLDAKKGTRRPVCRWLCRLRRHGLTPEMIDLEVGQPGADWIEAEQFWIAAFRVTGARLLNVAQGGEGSDGRLYTPEERRRLSEAHKHQRRTPECIERYRSAMAARRVAGVKRKPPSADAVEKMRATKARLFAEGKLRTRKGQKLNPEQVERISIARRAATTDEYRAKVSAAKRGTVAAEETKAALRAAQQARRAAERAAGGAKLSAEGLANMRAAQQRRRERERLLTQP